MADLGTLRPGAENTTGLPLAAGTIIDAPGASTALSDDSDASFDNQTSNASGQFYYGRELANTPGDFGSMNTLLIQFRYGWESTPVNTVWTVLGARVVASDGSTLLANGGSTDNWQSVASEITTATPTTSAVVAFATVNTTATQGDWDGASLQIWWVRTRSKGGDALGCRVYEAWVTGTYTTSAGGPAPLDPFGIRGFFGS